MNYDQRWVRKADTGYRMGTQKAHICTPCGENGSCGIQPNTASECHVFVPVLTFQGQQGFTGPLWNTFRRGPGWFRRLHVGSTVRFFDTTENEIVGEGTVFATHGGALAGLLDTHAEFNHVSLHNRWDAVAKPLLHNVLRKMYGNNYTGDDEMFSVIYVQPIKEVA